MCVCVDGEGGQLFYNGTSLLRIPEKKKATSLSNQNSISGMSNEKDPKNVVVFGSEKPTPASDCSLPLANTCGCVFL